jgi:hypothetical protein
LEDILNVLLMAEKATAQAEDNRTMPGNKGLERGFLALGRKPMEQLPVGCAVVTGQLSKVAEDQIQPSVGHNLWFSHKPCVSSTLIVPGTAKVAKFSAGLPLPCRLGLGECIRWRILDLLEWV